MKSEQTSSNMVNEALNRCNAEIQKAHTADAIVNFKIWGQTALIIIFWIWLAMAMFGCVPAYQHETNQGWELRGKGVKITDQIEQQISSQIYSFLAAARLDDERYSFADEDVDMLRASAPSITLHDEVLHYKGDTYAGLYWPDYNRIDLYWHHECAAPSALAHELAHALMYIAAGTVDYKHTDDNVWEGKNTLVTYAQMYACMYNCNFPICDTAQE